MKFQSIDITDKVFCRQQGLAHEVLQWYICRMEAWFAFDAIIIPLKTWDQASAIILVEGHKILFRLSFYTCPFFFIFILESLFYFYVSKIDCFVCDHVVVTGERVTR